MDTAATDCTQPRDGVRVGLGKTGDGPRFCIIGAGIAGLAAAFRLARAGHAVEVFEREESVGGLISTFDLAGTRIERYYHFLCGGDDGYLKLCEELGIADRIRFVRSRTGFFHEGREYGFTTPLDLLRFAPIPLSQRVRFGLFALEARWRTEWRQLDEIVARPWLIDRIGRQAYDVIWHPLLAMKFGDLYDGISAAWVWHRLHRVARSKGRMGYLEGGTQFLLDTLTSRIETAGGRIHRGRSVRRLVIESGRVAGIGLDDGTSVQCDRVISTLPMELLADLLPEDCGGYAAELRRVRYIGVVCAVFKLKKPVTRNFWLNINDSRVPCNGIIEYTNLNPMKELDGHIAYVPYYVAADQAPYTADDETVFRQSWDALRRVSPGLIDDDVIDWRVFRSAHAQAICPTHFLEAIPNWRSPIDGLFLTDSIFLYPEDRTQSGLILQAFQCAEAAAP